MHILSECSCKHGCLSLHLWMQACIYMFNSKCVCAYACVYVYGHKCLNVCEHGIHMNGEVGRFVCLHVCLCTYGYLWVYLCTFIEWSACVVVFYCCMEVPQITTNLVTKHNTQLLPPDFCGSGIQAQPDWYSAYCLTKLQIRCCLGLWAHLRLRVLFQAHVDVGRMCFLVTQGSMPDRGQHAWWKPAGKSLSLRPLDLLLRAHLIRSVSPRIIFLWLT